MAAVPSAIFSATLPVKPSVTTTSTTPSVTSVPSTKPWKSIGSVLSRSIAAAPRTTSSPLSSSVPTLSRPTRGLAHAQHDPREDLAHHRELEQVFGAALDVGAEIENDHRALAAPACTEAIAGRSMPGRRLEHELGHRHERAGVAGRDRRRGVALLHRVDREPHAGVAALAQRRAKAWRRRPPQSGVWRTRRALAQPSAAPRAAARARGCPRTARSAGPDAARAPRAAPSTTMPAPRRRPWRPGRWSGSSRPCRRP